MAHRTVPAVRAVGVARLPWCHCSRNASLFSALRRDYSNWRFANIMDDHEASIELLKLIIAQLV